MGLIEVTASVGKHDFGQACYASLVEMECRM